MTEGTPFDPQRWMPDEPPAEAEAEHGTQEVAGADAADTPRVDAAGAGATNTPGVDAAGADVTDTPGVDAGGAGAWDAPPVDAAASEPFGDEPLDGAPPAGTAPAATGSPLPGLAAEPEGAIPFPVPDDVADQSPEELSAALAAVCFALNRPVTLAEAAAILGRSEAIVADAADHLAGTLRSGGLMLQRHQSEIQLVTRPEVAWAVQRSLNPEKPGRLSRAATETLAIVAYRQPLTRAAVEAIRGVNCEAVLDSLERRGLIAEVGRQETPGHPRLFGTTLRFLQVVGLERIEDLPPLPEGLRVPELPAADWDAAAEATPSEPEPPAAGDIEVRGLAADPDEGYGDDLEEDPDAEATIEAAIEDAFDGAAEIPPPAEANGHPDGDDAAR